ncbi:DUF2239 family protein [Altererythrobacter sp. Root672]|uniref:DUF2239 family protein n=1 Tax=Altererythrobacter sp. Root672 TaxID=1736584 RepID=UPI0006FB4A25|nr:DUF2239 family protein [Altererythrobacter sp. Root672]KRA84126.1 hypothetical protein ASD76_09060 [Altererythrobacter sp. Root672]
MSVTVFHKGELLARGTAQEVVPQMRALEPLERASDLLVFDDDTGRQIDLDLREEEPARTRGRPSLGVKAREVTLLPRHWDWLNAQRGGASAALRRLVEEASKRAKGPEQGYDAAYRFLSAIAGDLPTFEDAVRELYAGNQVGYDHFTYDWPPAIRDHGRRLAFPE